MRGTVLQVVCAVCVVVCFHSAEAGPITLISQDRYVQAYTPSSNVVIGAIGFEDFSASVSSTYQSPSGFPYGTASASQQSQISDSVVTALGSASQGSFPGGGAWGYSVFDLTFELSAPATYEVTGTLSWSLDVLNLTLPFVKLVGPEGLIFEEGGYPNPFLQGYLQLSANGDLAPGEYQLTAQAAATYYHSAGESYNFAFMVVPEPSTTTLISLSAVILLFLVRSGRNS
jgi:hypothetical protein